jgi:hypothetical protein
MKRPAHCTLCDEPVFEIIAYFPDGHPRAGQPRRIGKPMDKAVRLHLLLTGGTTAAVTLCDACEPDLAEIWRRCLEAQADQQLNRVRYGVAPLTPRQQEQQTAELLALTRQVPLGVLYQEKLSDARR